MKKIAYFFAVGAMSLAACSSDPAYKISGTVEGVADGEYVYLQEGKGREWIKVDSAAVAGGAFTFNGRQDAAAYRYITYNAEGKRYRADFFLENGNIAVALGETSTATGTPNNDLYQAYKNEAAPLNKAIAEISKKFREGNLTDEQKEELNKQYEELDNKLTALTHSTIENNITNIVGLQLWPSASYAMELAKLQELAAKVPAEFKSNERIAKLLKRIEAMTNTAVGQKFVDFTLPDLNGNPLKLSDVIAKNKYTLIDFWASWCGPCRREMPNLVEAYKQYKGKNFEIVGVSLDDDEAAWKNMSKELKITWPQMSDLKFWQCEGAQLYAVSSIPHTVLIDGNGTIIARGLHGKALLDKIAEVVK